MTVADARPLLYLTADQAANWLSLHSEDVGREIVVVESPVRGLPYQQKKALAGFGRWEQGLAGGSWPRRTFFSPDFLARPPAWVYTELSDNPKMLSTVTFRLAGGRGAAYVVSRSGREAPVLDAVRPSPEHLTGVLVKVFRGEER